MDSTIVVKVRGEDSLLARFTASRTEATIEALVLGTDPDLLMVVRGVERAEADQLFEQLGAMHRGTQVLDDRGPVGIVARTRLDLSAIRSAPLRSLTTFVRRFQVPSLRVAGGTIEVRAGAPRAVAVAEAALIRAFLHKGGMLTDVTVRDGKHQVSPDLAAWQRPLAYA